MLIEQCTAFNIKNILLLWNLIQKVKDFLPIAKLKIYA